MERVERVKYHHPGSEELGETVREKAKMANILLPENHGVLVFDVNIEEARISMQTLEMACRLYVESRNAAIKANGLPRDEGYRT